MPWITIWPASMAILRARNQFFWFIVFTMFVIKCQQNTTAQPEECYRINTHIQSAHYLYSVKVSESKSDILIISSAWMAESSHSFLNVLDTPAWRFCTDKSHESCADTHIQRSCQRPRDNKLTNFHVVLLSIIYQKLKYEYSVDWFFIESVNLGLDKYRCLNCKQNIFTWL